MKTISFILLLLFLGACNMSDANFKVEIHKPCTYLVKNHPLPPLDPEADKWFKEARRLEKITGKPRDYSYMAELYQKAVKKNHWKAMYNLSAFYDVGLGVEKSTGKSLSLANKLIEMDVSWGYQAVGSLYSTGLGVPKDMKKAESYFYKAAIRGNAQSQTYLGNRLIFKHDNREEEGKHLLECALQQEYWDAAEKLSSYYYNKKNNNRESLNHVLIGIKNGNKESITSLSIEYASGDAFVKENKSKAECLDVLWDELKADPDAKFPNVESRCGISFDDLLPDRK